MARTAIDLTWEACDNAVNGVIHGTYNTYNTPAPDGETVNLPAAVFPSGGTFTMTVNGQTTTPIPYNASPSTIVTALSALSTVGAGKVTAKGEWHHGILIDWDVTLGALTVSVTPNLIPVGYLNSAIIVPVRAATAGAGQESGLLIGLFWLNVLNITKNIKLIGNTTITFGPKVNNKASIVFAINDINFQTVLRSYSGQVLQCSFTAGPNNPLIQGITVTGKNNIEEINESSIIVAINGTHRHIRMTQCYFPYHRNKFLGCNSGGTAKETAGVVDHCVSEQNLGGEKITVRADGWEPPARPGTYVLGDGSMMDGLYFTDTSSNRYTKAWYFEDCTLLGYDKTTGELGEGHGAWDLEAGGRRVCRHCYVVNAAMACHGTESGGYRGGRMQENYRNILDYRNSQDAGTQIRGGTSMIWENDIWADINYQWQPTAYRQVNYIPNKYLGANGVFLLDAMATTPSTVGNFIYDQTRAGNPTEFWPGWAGTVTGTAVNAVTTTIAPAGGSWDGYIMRNVSTGKFRLIKNIVGNIVNFYAGLSGQSAIGYFPAGTVISVNHMAQASLDAPARGVCDFVDSRTTPVATNTDHPGVWPHQRLEPIYAWMNTLSTVHSGLPPNTADYATPGAPYTLALNNAFNTTPTLNDNVDSFNQVGGVQTSPTSPFNGTIGTGFGTIANRPTTFTYASPPAQPMADPAAPSINVYPRCGYWATDEEKFYVQTATNTWVLYYQPVAYPHELVTGVVAVSRQIGLSGNMDFGTVNVGTTGHRTLTISNTGNNDLHVTNILIKDAGGNTITQYVASPLTGTIVSFGHLDVDISFAPSASSIYNGTITVVSDATGGSNTAPITGIGTTPGNATLTITGDLNFGALGSGVLAQRNVTVANTGNVPAIITNVTHDPGVNVSWTSRTINQGLSDTLVVTADTSQPGTFTGAVTFTSNAGGDNHINFSLTVGQRRIYFAFGEG